MYKFQSSNRKSDNSATFLATKNQTKLHLQLYKPKKAHLNTFESQEITIEKTNPTTTRGMYDKIIKHDVQVTHVISRMFLGVTHEKN